MRALSGPLLLLAAAGFPVAAGATPGEPQQDWQQVARCGGFLEAPTRLPSGDLAVSDPLNGRLLRIDPHGQCHELLRSDDLPNGQAIDADGNLIVARRGGLMRVDPVTGTITPLVEQFEGEPLDIANDLSVDRHGGIYFTVPGRSNLLRPDGRVFYLPAGSREPDLVAGGLAFPNGVAVAPDGNSIRVAEFAAKRILWIPTRHSTLKFNVPHVFAHTVGGVGPDGLAFDADGVLYAANIEAGTVSRWTPAGAPLPDLKLPPEAGLLVTNVLVEDGWLYVTEAAQGVVWRVRLD
ncbi:SMP-30/gluconolactonase/LRE family protein [Altererythrobacter sp. H2]|uniref:SMP-30/gluconolactonase/LRE family protein n=1 Tax=Altererythrobacter sp. H2 TaxID=3108391 RepID=UPI002B4BD0B6|nr:SMP-30/gluconolactonase/LRE family protein [Altererythrobacter sp. H2]WRK95166.1 SMP-30/gluconolactonase/LRE family protein [Altererythrobacter sp. H2]